MIVPSKQNKQVARLPFSNSLQYLVAKLGPPQGFPCALAAPPAQATAAPQLATGNSWPATARVSKENHAGRGKNQHQVPITSVQRMHISGVEGKINKCLSLESSYKKLLSAVFFPFLPKNKLGNCFKELLRCCMWF